MKKRRNFLKGMLQSAVILGGASLTHPSVSSISGKKSSVKPKNQPKFDISLAEWSLRSLLRDGTITNLDFPTYTKNTFGIHALEYVNSYFKDKAKDTAYLKSLKQRCADEGVKSVLIMVDGEGPLADSDTSKRKQAVENHKKWVEAAAELGCHAIRVNAFSESGDDYSSSASAYVQSMGELGEFGKDFGISILMENHGGYSSNGYWINHVFSQLPTELCGTLPDFGNFTVNAQEGIVFPYLRGMQMLMPYAKGVSAKSLAFDENGLETTMDYERIMAIVKNAGYEGYIGIEWGGKPDRASTEKGIMDTKRLLLKIAYQHGWSIGL